MTSYHVERDQMLEEYYRLIGKGNMKTASLLMADLFLLLSERIEELAKPSNGDDSSFRHINELSRYITQRMTDAPSGAQQAETTFAVADANQLDLFGNDREDTPRSEPDEPRDKLGRRIGVRGVTRPRLHRKR